MKNHKFCIHTNEGICDTCKSDMNFSMKTPNDKVSECCKAYPRWNSLMGEYVCQQCGKYCRLESSTPPVAEGWESVFDKLWKRLGLHLGYANEKDLGIKAFIHQTREKAYEAGRKSCKCFGDCDSSLNIATTFCAHHFTEKIKEARTQAIQEIREMVDKLPTTIATYSNSHEVIDTCEIYRVLNSLASKAKDKEENGQN